MEAKNKAKSISKTILWVSVAAVALIGVFFLARMLVKKLKKTSDKSATDKAKKEVNEKELSYSPSEYAGMADRVYREMDGVNLPTDSYSSTFDVLKKVNNKSDWNALVVAFGTRESSRSLPFTSPFRGDLVRWMEDELSSSQLAEAGSILSRAGVNVF
jgi:hypothetical protein